MDISTTAFFTGHRIIPKNALPALNQKLYAEVFNLYKSGYRDFICGGAIGFDTIAAECVLSLKKRLTDIKLGLFLPCRDQTEKWNSIVDLSKYKTILGQADYVDYASDFYCEGCMLLRNRKMANASSVCIAYLSQNKGGTAYTVNYAKKRGLRIINLYEDPEQIYFFR